jgi:hypothetical protein
VSVGTHFEGMRKFCIREQPFRCVYRVHETERKSLRKPFFAFWWNQHRKILISIRTNADKHFTLKCQHPWSHRYLHCHERQNDSICDNQQLIIKTPRDITHLFMSFRWLLEGLNSRAFSLQMIILIGSLRSVYTAHLIV